MDCQRAVLDERFKLIECFVDGQQTRQLFDLAGDPAYAQHRERLRDRLAQWQNSVDDPLAGTWST